MLKKRVLVGTLALALLCTGALGSQALAGKKKKTTVVVNSGPVLNGQQKVKVGGSLNTTTACRVGPLDAAVPDRRGRRRAGHDRLGDEPGGGTWKLSAKLTSPPTPDQYLQVKAKKLTVGKFVCKAGLSKLIEIK